MNDLLRQLLQFCVWKITVGSSNIGRNVFMYLSVIISAEEDSQLIPTGMTNDCVAQAWFRFLHSLGNPVDMCRPAVISQTQKFLQFAITSETVMDPCQHPCLAVLPQIFLKAVKGIAGLVDSFLGK